MSELNGRRTTGKFSLVEQALLPTFVDLDLERKKVVNVASVKHRSPFRYPGGKTWLVPVIRKWLATIPRVKHFVEPFAGGAIVSLSVLFDDLADDVTLIEKDSNVGAVWQTVVSGDAPQLAKLIAEFDLSEESVRSLFNGDLAPDDIIGRAFKTIVRNRVQRGGIMAPGASLMRNGENGRGLKSRWYPETLKTRLLDLHAKHSQIRFQSGDGVEYMMQNANCDTTGWFIDPPYTMAGRRLYTHSELDHRKLFEETARLAGPFLMTYDDTAEIRTLAAENGFQIKEVAMKNSHHAIINELLIGRDLDRFDC